MRLLIRLLLLDASVSLAEAADEGTAGRADGSALARVPGDGAADGADCRASAPAANHAALRRGRRRGDRCLACRRIDTGLLPSPLGAFPLVALTLIGTLSARGIDDDLLCPGCGDQQLERHRCRDHERQVAAPLRW